MYILHNFWQLTTAKHNIKSTITMLSFSLIVSPNVFFPSSSIIKSLAPKYSNPSLKICNSMSSQQKTTAKFCNEDGRSSNTSALTEPPSSLSSYLLPKNDDVLLKAGLKKELIPQHIAVIFDGNRRWLKAKGKPLDYEPFLEKNALFADLCLKYGVETATTYVYAYTNLNRGREANELLFGQVERFFGDNLETFIRKQIRVTVLGERKECTKSLQDMIEQVEEATRRYVRKPKLNWRFAICYGGTRDIVQATRKLCEKVKAGVIESSSIDESLMERELEAGGAPPPELLIRTGGELRLSNYLMWHLALTELYFIQPPAPEFTEDHFLDALHFYQQIDRTFGE